MQHDRPFDWTNKIGLFLVVIRLDSTVFIVLSCNGGVLGGFLGLTNSPTARRTDIVQGKNRQILDTQKGEKLKDLGEIDHE